MTYKNITKAIFIDRPNRFIAHVSVNGTVLTAHVKNTGRCKELLIPGAEVWLTESENPLRKTAYDLVAVRKSNGIPVNIDSQAPNKVAYEWLKGQNFDRIVPEHTYGNSRVDFYMERGEERFLMEVKGCTLEVDGIGYFPDAPTERGVKHIRELIKAKEEGYRAILAFVIQMDGVTEVRANVATHPEFGEAMEDAKRAGVQILFLPCHVEPDSITVVRNVPTVYCGTHTPQGYENLEAGRVMDLDRPVPTVLAEVDFSEAKASGKYVCSVCGYVYDPAEHDGVAFEDLPDDWKCPRCKQPKEKFNKA